MDKYGLLGKSLGHSFSRSFFQKYFEEKKVSAEYHNLEIDSLNMLKESIIDFKGFNVTIPYKESIIPFLDEISTEAKNIGSVNVVKIKDGKLIGYNSDAYGFHQMIKPFLCNVHERAIVFGTGGASKAIIYVLEMLGIDVVQVSRNKSEISFTYDEVNDIMINSCKMLVNCTPVGMYPDVKSKLDIPYHKLTKDHLVVDLIYNPETTEFLRLSKLQNATILNGLGMLHHQALKSWEIWQNE